MADEQAQVEETTEVVEQSAPEETTSNEVTDSEVAQTQPDDDGAGDLRVPLREERSKRQAYEKMLQDPQFIYEQARKLGLTEDAAEAVASQPQTQTPAYPAQDIPTIVSLQLDFERTIEKDPELKSDPAMRTWFASLMDNGHRPSEAADIIHKALEKRTASIRKEAVSAEKAAISEKERATTLTTTTATSSEESEIDALRAQAKNWKDPKAQTAAQLELLKRNMK